MLRKRTGLKGSDTALPLSPPPPTPRQGTCCQLLLPNIAVVSCPLTDHKQPSPRTADPHDCAVSPPPPQPNYALDVAGADAAAAFSASVDGHRNNFDEWSSEAVAISTGGGAASPPTEPPEGGDEPRSTNRMSRIMSVWPVKRLVHSPVRASQARTLPSTQAVKTTCVTRCKEREGGVKKQRRVLRATGLRIVFFLGRRAAVGGHREGAERIRKKQQRNPRYLLCLSLLFSPSAQPLISAFLCFSLLFSSFGLIACLSLPPPPPSLSLHLDSPCPYPSLFLASSPPPPIQHSPEPPGATRAS